MAYRNLDIGNRGAVRIITVNRPDKLNALNRDTLNELTLAFAQAAQDDAVRAVVLAGAGDKAFVAGADIAEMNGYTPVQAQGFSRAGQRLMSSIERLGFDERFIRMWDLYLASCEATSLVTKLWMKRAFSARSSSITATD